MHVSIVRMDKKSSPELRGPRYLPELEALMKESEELQEKTAAIRKQSEAVISQIKQET